MPFLNYKAPLGALFIALNKKTCIMDFRKILV